MPYARSNDLHGRELRCTAHVESEPDGETYTAAAVDEVWETALLEPEQPSPTATSPATAARVTRAKMDRVGSSMLCP